MICSRCVMDSSVPGIFFDDSGECNFCKIHDERVRECPINQGQKTLESIVEKIKKEGGGRDYDCLIGVSGGIDSTYAVYLARKLGLRPLAVHMDNGWNSELSVKNIENFLKKLDVDLHTIVLDWEEFRDIQIAFLKASVPDIEVPTDLAIAAILYRTAREMGIKYVLDGQSFRTGGKCPIGWSYADGKYIRSVHKMFGKKEMKDFPNMTTMERIYYMFFKRIKFVSLLNCVEYNVEEVKELLKNDLGWREYGDKHCESVYTRFVHSTLLPKKFNIDNRRIHYSALVRSGQMTRDEAIKKLEKPMCPEEVVEDDRKYVIKKLGLTEEEFEEILSKPPKLFLDYPNNYRLVRFLVKVGCSLGMLSKKHKYYTWNTLLEYHKEN